METGSIDIDEVELMKKLIETLAKGEVMFKDESNQTIVLRSDAIGPERTTMGYGERDPASHIFRQ